MFGNRNFIKQKITTDDVKNSRKIGRGWDFERKFEFIQGLGCFPVNLKSISEVKKELYEPPHNKGQHFENVLRSDKATNFIQLELDFLRECLAYKFENARDKEFLSDAEFLECSADALIAKLLNASTEQKWDNYDPVHTLINLVTSERIGLVIEFAYEKRPNYRFPGSENSPKISTAYDDPIEKVSHSDKFTIGVYRDNDGVKILDNPMLLAISHRNIHVVNNKIIRAQVQRNVRILDEDQKEGDDDKKRVYWEYFADDGGPLNMQGVTGDFFLLAVGNTGKEATELFPVDADLDLLSTEDLAHLCNELNQFAVGFDSVVYGIKNYRIFSD